jgi:hypothetical protein
MYIFTHLCHPYQNTDELLDRQEIGAGLNILNIILSQLDEPINRSVTQLSKVVDHLESERSFFFQIIERKSNKKFRVRTR